MFSHMDWREEDREFAARLIARFGKKAGAQTELRIAELEENGEHAAARQWRRVLQLIRFELDRDSDPGKPKKH